MTNTDKLVDYILGNTKKQNSKQYDYREQIINDCISELKKKHEAYCFKESQVMAIQAIISCNVSYNGIYTLSIA